VWLGHRRLVRENDQGANLWHLPIFFISQRTAFFLPVIMSKMVACRLTRKFVFPYRVRYKVLVAVGGKADIGAALTAEASVVNDPKRHLTLRYWCDAAGDCVYRQPRLRLNRRTQLCQRCSINFRSDGNVSTVIRTISANNPLTK
jgi:hypothetical protein